MQLAKIAVDHGFDGWLVNIENKVDSEAEIATLVHFLETLTENMRLAGSRRRAKQSRTRSAAAPAVIWYDSVTTDGELDWQDKLNGKNKRFFDACDGIYTNYAWKADDPSRSALAAEGRRWDVYTGVDVFGRGTWGGGGFDADKALAQIRRAGVSAALFAPAWTMQSETPGGGRVDPLTGRDWQEVEKDFNEIDSKFWAKLREVWHRGRPVTGFPVGDGSTATMVANFGRGVGDTWRIEGSDVASFSGSGGGGEGVGSVVCMKLWETCRLCTGVPEKRVWHI